MRAIKNSLVVNPLLGTAGADALTEYTEYGFAVLEAAATLAESLSDYAEYNNEKLSKHIERQRAVLEERHQVELEAAIVEAKLESRQKLLAAHKRMTEFENGLTAEEKKLLAKFRKPAAK